MKRNCVAAPENSMGFVSNIKWLNRESQYVRPTEGAFLSPSPFSPFSRSPVGKEKKGRGRREVPRELSNSANFIRRRHSGGLWKRREKGGGRQNVAWEGRRGGGEMRTRISPPPFPFPRRLCHCKPPFPALQLSRKSGKLLLQSLGAISPSVHCRFQKSLGETVLAIFMIYAS